MCWIGKNIPQIAEEDIEVFKVVKRNYSPEEPNSFISLYFYHPYKLGETYESEIKIKINYDNDGTVSINKALHSYSAKDCHISYVIFNDEYSIAFSYSDGRTLIDDDIPNDIEIVRLNCVIPKGATYYKNRVGEFASDKLRVVSAENIN